MLKSEVAPFADYHKEEIRKVRQTISSIYEAYESGAYLGITQEDLRQDLVRLTEAMRALDRFSAAVLDGIRTTERLRSTTQ